MAITTDLIWDNVTKSVPEIMEHIKGHLLQCAMLYIIHPKFIKYYQEHGEDAAFVTISPSLYISREQFMHDRIVLYGMMKSVFCKPTCKKYHFQHSDMMDSIKTFNKTVTENRLGRGISIQGSHCKTQKCHTHPLFKIPS